MANEILIAKKANFSQDNNQLIRNIFNRVNDLVYIMNTKYTAIYDNTEVFTSKQWYFGQNTNKQKMMYQKVIDTGALPNAGATATNHNLGDGGAPITGDWDIIFKTLKAFDPVNTQWIVDPPQTFIIIDATQVSIITSLDLSAFTQSQVILEYTKA